MYLCFAMGTRYVYLYLTYVPMLRNGYEVCVPIPEADGAEVPEADGFEVFFSAKKFSKIATGKSVTLNLQFSKSSGTVARPSTEQSALVHLLLASKPKPRIAKALPRAVDDSWQAYAKFWTSVDEKLRTQEDTATGRVLAKLRMSGFLSPPPYFLRMWFLFAFEQSKWRQQSPKKWLAWRPSHPDFLEMGEAEAEIYWRRSRSIPPTYEGADPMSSDEMRDVQAAFDKVMKDMGLKGRASVFALTPKGVQEMLGKIMGVEAPKQDWAAASKKLRDVMRSPEKMENHAKKLFQMRESLAGMSDEEVIMMYSRCCEQAACECGDPRHAADICASILLYPMVLERLEKGRNWIVEGN